MPSKHLQISVLFIVGLHTYVLQCDHVEETAETWMKNYGQFKCILQRYKHSLTQKTEFMLVVGG